MAGQVAGERLMVSLSRESADVHVRRARLDLDGIEADLASPLGPLRLRSPLLGRFNLENLALAASVCLALGVDARAIERGLAGVAGVPGRMERVCAPPAPTGAAPAPGPTVLVDYAHSPDALDNALATLRPLATGRLLCVFGCGGDRDRGKRPLMGRVAAERADVIVVTSDNPRTEEPLAIIEAIREGIAQAGVPFVADLALVAQPGAPRAAYVEPDREAAIAGAVAIARPGDVVLVAGKGHEDYQIVGATRHAFDDRLVAAEALARRAGADQSGGTE